MRWRVVAVIAMYGVLGAMSGLLPALASVLGFAISPSPAPWGNWEPILSLMLFVSIGLVLGLIGGYFRAKGKRFSTALATCIGTQIGGMICMFTSAMFNANHLSPAIVGFLGPFSDALAQMGIDGVEPHVVLLILPVFIGFIAGLIYTVWTWNRMSQQLPHCES